MLGVLSFTVAGKVMASVVWAKPGAMGYKEAAPANSPKTCGNCGWFQKDAKTPDGGLCKFAGIQNAAKSKEVHVKSAGICNMWKKA